MRDIGLIVLVFCLSLTLSIGYKNSFGQTKAKSGSSFFTFHSTTKGEINGKKIAATADWDG